jgi:hypothetical protein
MLFYFLRETVLTLFKSGMLSVATVASTLKFVRSPCYCRMYDFSRCPDGDSNPPPSERITSSANVLRYGICKDKRDRQCMYNVTLRRIVVVEKQ